MRENWQPGCTRKGNLTAPRTEVSKAYVWFQSRQDAWAQIGPSRVFSLLLLSSLPPSGSLADSESLQSLADRNSDPR